MSISLLFCFSSFELTSKQHSQTNCNYNQRDTQQRSVESHAMAMVSSVAGAATRNATTPTPAPTIVPAIGKTSATTESGLRIKFRPIIIQTKPAKRRSHVSILLLACASAIIASAECSPICRSSIEPLALVT